MVNGIIPYSASALQGKIVGLVIGGCSVFVPGIGASVY